MERTCLKLVEANARKQSCESQHPHPSCLHLGYPVVWEIIDDASLETNVRMDEDRGAEDRVGQWVERATDEWGESERDQTGGDKSVIVVSPAHPNSS